MDSSDFSNDVFQYKWFQNTIRNTYQSVSNHEIIKSTSHGVRYLIVTIARWPKYAQETSPNNESYEIEWNWNEIEHVSRTNLSPFFLFNCIANEAPKSALTLISPA